MKVIIRGGPLHNKAYSVSGSRADLRVEHGGERFIVPIYMAENGQRIALWKEAERK